MITVNSPKSGDKAPLYHKYPGQNEPQGAYIEIDCKNEAVHADWNGVIGNAIPFSVYRGHDRRYGVSAYLSLDAINRLFADPEFVSFCQRIVDGYSSEWDGNNHVAVLDDDAQAAEEELEAMIGQLGDSDDTEVWDVADYLYEVRRGEIDAKTSDEALAKWVAECESGADGDNVMIDGDVEDFANELRYEKRREAIEDYLNDGDPDIEVSFENTMRDDENPVYEVNRSGKIYFVVFDPDGKLTDTFGQLKTDFVQAYPDGGSYEIYKTLIAHADGTSLRIKSDNPMTNPNKLKILLRASRDSNWKPFPLRESEEVFDLYLYYGIKYPWQMNQQRNDRLKRDRDEAINHYRQPVEDRERKINENTARINALQREMQKLKIENIDLSAEAARCAEWLAIRTREYEAEYQRLLSKGEPKAAA